MGRCRYEKLEKIESALEEFRMLENIKEPKPGIFYKKSQSFLHFHEKDDKIWADVKVGPQWVSIDIPEKVSKKFLKDFVTTITTHFENA